MKHINLNNRVFGFNNDSPFVLIAGPCQVESLQHSIDMCGLIREIAMTYEVPFVFKSSFDKANRTSANSKRGAGPDLSMDIFEYLQKEFDDVPLITDIHTEEQTIISQVVDIIQIPAFLSRQTDLLVAAAMTNKPVMIKKGQFMAPWDMKNVISKIEHINDKILLCERGASFGYNRLVSDMTALPIMKETKYPVIFDATHSVQQPGGNGTTSGGNRDFVPVLAKCAITTGIAGIFMEVHQDPDNAPSDGPNMLRLDSLDKLLSELVELDEVTKNGFIA